MYEFEAIGKKENRMKPSATNEVKCKLQRLKRKSKAESGKLNDPTLEGKDERKIGRIQGES